MPIRTVETIPGERVIEFICEGCGGIGRFGIDVNIRDALRSGDVRRGGRWFCGWRGGQPVCVQNAQNVQIDETQEQST